MVTRWWRSLVLFLSNGTGAARLAAPPSHLVVLVHGLHGTYRDLLCLETELLRTPGVITLAIRSNEGATTDGVRAGAERVAGEVASAVSDNPTLQRISFVGNSLGGLYARKAVQQLHQSRSARIAGLCPEAFVTIASPHLGTRKLAWCPPPVQLLSPIVAGQTASDLFLHNTVLEAMTDKPHLEALRSFKRRVLYANSEGDLMVPRYTSAIESALSALDPRERLMANRLRSMPWRTVYVQFEGLPLPITHNLICGLARDPLSAAMYRRGATVMSDAALAICDVESSRQSTSTVEVFSA